MAAVIAAVVTYIAAVLSFRLVERPALRLKDRMVPLAGARHARRVETSAR